MTPATSLLQQVVPDLTAWLRTQRWFADKGRVVTRIDTVRVVELVDKLDDGGPLGLLTVLRLSFADGGASSDYQVPLAFRHQGTAPAHPPAARVDDIDCYDGLRDPHVVIALLRLMASGTRSGGLRFRGDPVLAGILDRAPSVRLLDVEQTNSSVVIGDQAILKVFRRLPEGPSPDLELHRALARARSRHIAALLGTVESESPHAPVTYAMVQIFAASAVEGWALALDSARDVLTGHQRNGGRAGRTGDFHAEAYQLGRTVAQVHAELAGELGSQRLGTTALDELADQLAGELDDALRTVPELRTWEPDLRRVYADLSQACGEMRVQRVHGDLHLGQTLRTPETWWLIDFEGEPARTLADRLLPQTPMRDVAGILRSLDYAAYCAGVQGPATALDDRLRVWLASGRAELCRGYASITGIDPRAQGPLLPALELSRAVYEAAYEARNRPEWLPIPLHAIERLLTSVGV